MTLQEYCGGFMISNLETSVGDLVGEGAGRNYLYATCACLFVVGVAMKIERINESITPVGYVSVICHSV